MTSCILPGHVTGLAFEAVAASHDARKAHAAQNDGLPGRVRHYGSSGEPVLTRQPVRRACLGPAGGQIVDCARA